MFLVKLLAAGVAGEPVFGAINQRVVGPLGHGRPVEVDAPVAATRDSTDAVD